MNGHNATSNVEAIVISDFNDCILVDVNVKYTLDILSYEPICRKTAAH